MRSLNDLRPIECFDIRFERGGMGDSIARLPAVRYILKQPHIKRVRLFVQDYFVGLAAYLLNDAKVTVFGLGEMEAELKARPSTHGSWTDNTIHTTLRTHLTDHAFHTICDIQPEEYEKYYLQAREGLVSRLDYLPARSYVVISTGFTAPVREWLPSEVNKVIDWCIANNLTPVFLGKEESKFLAEHKTDAYFRGDITYDRGVNLINQTGLLETLAIIQRALAVVGVDNGLMHLAGCTDTAIVGGFTTVESRHRKPYRPNGIFKAIDAEGPCTFCQSKMVFNYDSDFRMCYYNTYECLPTMRGERFIEQLERLKWLYPSKS